MTCQFSMNALSLDDDYVTYKFRNTISKFMYQTENIYSLKLENYEKLFNDSIKMKISANTNCFLIHLSKYDTTINNTQLEFCFINVVNRDYLISNETNPIFKSIKYCGEIAGRKFFISISDSIDISPLLESGFMRLLTNTDINNLTKINHSMVGNPYPTMMFFQLNFECEIETTVYHKIPKNLIDRTPYLQSK